MAFVHENSCECTKSELDLFTVPPTQTSIESGSFVEYHPVSSIGDGGPIEFDVQSSGQFYLDFANTQLHVRAKITKADGTDLDADSPTGPVNLFLHSLFQQVDVSLNDTQVTQSSGTYAYRAYIETLLSYGPQAKTSQLSSGLYFKDTPGKMDKGNPHHANAVDRNPGLVHRSEVTNESHVADMCGRLHADIFFQDRYLLNEVNVKIRLVRNKDVFCIMSNQHAHAFKVSILSAVLMVRKVQISPSVFVAHAKVLENGLAKYPIRRVVCKTYTIPAGNLDGNHEKLFTGQLPTRLVVGCVDNDAFNGNYEKNPFNFKHFDLTEITVHLDGHSHPLKPIKTNYNTGEYIQAYMSLFSGTGKEYKDEGNDIAREDYDKGYSLYAFDLTPDLSEEGHFNLVKQGALRLELKFGTALPNTVTVIAYAEFENVIEIDRNRNVVYDFSG